MRGFPAGCRLWAGGRDQACGARRRGGWGGEGGLAASHIEARTECSRQRRSHDAFEPAGLCRRHLRHQGPRSRVRGGSAQARRPGRGVGGRVHHRRRQRLPGAGAGSGPQPSRRRAGRVHRRPRYGNCRHGAGL
ncbi:hypothetical protein G6F68_011336 [Rhizopus microsporus]|nr:hypothetical protein G6F68_011336 [Rhizopus microsporus]